jgi:hypothetical protein
VSEKRRNGGRGRRRVGGRQEDARDAVGDVAMRERGPFGQHGHAERHEVERCEGGRVAGRNHPSDVRGTKDGQLVIALAQLGHDLRDAERGGVDPDVLVIRSDANEGEAELGMSRREQRHRAKDVGDQATAGSRIAHGDDQPRRSPRLE